MSNFRPAVQAPPAALRARQEDRPPAARSQGSFEASLKGWPPYIPGYFGPYSLPRRQPSAILDLRDKRMGKGSDTPPGDARFCQGAVPLPYHSLYFDPQDEGGDWTHFSRFMPPGQMPRRAWKTKVGEVVRFPAHALAAPNYINRVNYRGYHFLPDYTRRRVVGDPAAPWNKDGELAYKSYAAVVPN